MGAEGGYCGKTPVHERRILALVIGAGPLIVRRFAVSAVQEGSSPVSGGSRSKKISGRKGTNRGDGDLRAACVPLSVLL